MFPRFGVFLTRVHEQPLLQLLRRRTAGASAAVAIDARKKPSRGRGESLHLPPLSRAPHGDDRRAKAIVYECDFSGDQLHSKRIVERLQLVKNLVGSRM